MIKINTLTISLDYFLFAIVVFPYLTPPNVKQLPLFISMDSILVYLGLFIMACTIIKYINLVRWPIILIAISYLLLVIASVRYGGNSLDALNHGIKVILLCLFFSMEIQLNESKTETLVKIIKTITFIYFAINLVFMILYPQGMPQYTTYSTIPCFLYGNVNSTIKYIFPGRVGFMIDSKKKGKPELPLLIMLIGMIYSFAFVYIQATAIAAIIFLCVWYVFSDKIYSRIKSIYLWMIGIVTFLEVSLVVLSNSKVIYYMASLFGKNITFSNRTILWDNAIQKIKINLLIGYGQQRDIVLREMIGNKSGSHNYYLDITFQRGICALMIFIIVLLLVAIYLKKDNLTYGNYYLTGACVSYLLMFIYEPFYNTEYLFIPMFYTLLISLMNEERNKFYDSGNII